MIKQTLFILSIFLFCEIVFGFTSKSLKVKFQHGGVLIGKHKITVNGRHVRAFTGIPYAKPPVGELRFKL
uniref:Carboxylesterase type B domain-containing protein n=1 Tax=Megaselia scalaris TaxID=36166 RepID=T1GWE1_MEGSC